MSPPNLTFPRDLPGLVQLDLQSTGESSYLFQDTLFLLPSSSENEFSGEVRAKTLMSKFQL